MGFEMSDRPSLSVVVPVLNGMTVLPSCLEALATSDLPRDRWELVVVDDGSTDGTRDLAEQHADRVVVVDDGPKGPAFARNRGSESASGEILLFIDADVCVHPDTLRRTVDLFEDPSITAAFGAYDDDPAVPGFMSQYRNLLHRYVHLQGAGDAETFWAGCGAVRRQAFLEVGGYDASTYPRPQIEDIDLGYRLGEAGHRIVLDPSLQVKHLKTWTLRNTVRTDLFDRAVPWVRLLMERERSTDSDANLNVNSSEKLKVALVGLSLLCLLVSIVTVDSRWLAGSLLLAALVLIQNAAMFRWFAHRRGAAFAMAVMPMNLLYYAISGTAVVIGTASHYLSGRRRRSSLAPLRSATHGGNGA